MRRFIAPILLTILVLLVSAPLPLAPFVRAQEAPPGERCFPETGFCLRGRFLDHWEQGGGLAIYGFPITGELWEDGRLVQYLERNRFELHPENARPYDVLLGRLGVERLQADGRDWQALAPGRAVSGCRFFPETRHSLCGRFLDYWEQNGGLALFGYPVSEPAEEQNEANGRFYTVQYFERNRFELHPENAPPYDVLLGLLGSWRAGWLFGENRAPYGIRATIDGPGGALAPLAPLTLSVTAPGYDGPAEIRVFDTAGRTLVRQPITIAGGRASVDMVAGGALGPHPAVLLIDGQVAGLASAAYVLDAETGITTGLARYDELWPVVRAMQERNVSEYVIGDQKVRGHRSPDSYLIWLRDHVYQAIGYRYFERDMTSALDYFRRSQRADGSFDDFFANPPWGRVQGRMEVEADLEFLFVQGAFQAWQATGDDGWLRAALPAMERGLAYTTSDPNRWEPALGLVKRPLTVDMWDFEYGGPTIGPDGKLSGRHWIDADTKWGVMHGDNTGLAYAMTLMARIAEREGDGSRAAEWRARAADLVRRLNDAAWNGSFYAHRVPLSPFAVPGIDERQQLSLSNAYALNREVLNVEQATSILNEYQRRGRDNPGAFAEWYSIDPPFLPDSFGTGPSWGDAPGTYVNGGIMPLVGGELARGAFTWGQEGYGFGILNRYYFVLKEQGGSYLWYYPAGNPGISGTETVATDGWGSSAMLAALIEGAAGVVDRGKLLKDVVIAPRWAVDPEVTTANVTVRYGASYGYAAYRWERLGNGLRLTTSGTAELGTMRILLPPWSGEQVNVSIGGAPVQFQLTTVGESRYVELPLVPGVSTVDVSW